MKLLKTSIVILFLLSVLSAGLALYLSTIRENEKEKRVYLEGVKADLEKHVASLESERAQLEEKVSSLESEKQELTKKFEEEKEAHQKVLDQLHEKDRDLEGLKGEADQAKKAFENAQKRNQELERILDELESRMKQVESQKNLTTGSNPGYIDVSVVQAKPNLSNPTLAQIIQPKAVDVSQTSQTVAESQVTATTPVTNLPTPPKRRKFFPFFHSSNQQKSETQAEAPPAESTPVKTVTTTATTTEQFVQPTTTEKVKEKVQEPVKQQVATQTAGVTTSAAASHKADQSIAAGNVLLVNRQYNFIVINLGSRQGLNLDNILAVQHNGTEIAKVRVEKLYDDYSAAYIVEEQSEHPIAEGDSVTAT